MYHRALTCEIFSLIIHKFWGKYCNITFEVLEKCLFIRKIERKKHLIFISAICSCFLFTTKLFAWIELIIFFKVGELTKEIEHLPLRSQLSAAYLNYLGAQPEDVRRSYKGLWCELAGLEEFDMRGFLSSESQMLVWKGEGLPSDNLSMENALMILKVHSWQF